MINRHKFSSPTFALSTHFNWRGRAIIIVWIFIANFCIADYGKNWGGGPGKRSGKGDTEEGLKVAVLVGQLGILTNISSNTQIHFIYLIADSFGAQKAGTLFQYPNPFP